jgi:hypothetical protein
MPAPVDLSGRRIGRLTVKTLAKERTKDRKCQWNCLCDCGRHTVVRGTCLTSGKTQSCGCLVAENDPNPARFEAEIYPVTTAKGVWIDCHTLRRKRTKKIYLTVAGGVLTYHLPRKAIERGVEKPTRFLTDKQGNRRTIDHLWVSPPYPRSQREVLVLLDEDLRDFATNRQAREETLRIKTDKGERWLRGRFIAGTRGYVVYEPVAVHTDEDGREWLSDVQLMQAFGVGPGFLLWANKESRNRPGEKALRKKKIPNAVRQKGSPGVINVYLKEDAKIILEGGESERLGVGKGKNARRLAELQLKKAEQAVETLLANGRQLKTGSLVKLVKEKARVGITIARRAIRRTTMELKEGRNHFRRLDPSLIGSPMLHDGERSEQAVSPNRRGRRTGSKGLKATKRHERMVAWYHERLEQAGSPPSVKAAAEHFQCDRSTIRSAWREANILTAPGDLIPPN